MTTLSFPASDRPFESTLATRWCELSTAFQAVAAETVAALCLSSALSGRTACPRATRPN